MVEGGMALVDDGIPSDIAVIIAEVPHVED